jgi:phosphate transport system substrate-binding protein
MQEASQFKERSVKRTRTSILIGVAIACLLAGCKSASGPGAASSGEKLTGAGASFPYPIYSKWFSEYSAAHPGVEINYQSIGSGGGIRQVTSGLVDFGASDMPMTDEALAGSKIKLIHIPTVLGAVVPIFNVPGVSELKFGPDVLADIYLSKITRWNDPRIAKDNPGAKLPDTKIIAVHRSDGSGTSFIFTDYLSKVSKDWAKGPGTNSNPSWPGSGKAVSAGAKGNEGVASTVRQLPGAVGYVELIYALQNKIDFGEVKNSAGNYVKASIDGVTAAAASVKDMPADYRISITNAPGDQAYPISSFTYLLVPAKTDDPNKAKVIKDMLGWIVKTGEGEVTTLSYAPLPPALAEKVQKTIDSLQ